MPVLPGELSGRHAVAGLRLRLILLVLAIGVPLWALATYTAVQDRSESVALARAGATRIAHQAADRHAAYLEGARKLLFCLSEIPEVRRGDPVYCPVLFARLTQGSPQYLNFGIIGLDGRVLASGLPMKEPVNLGDRSYFLRAVQSRDFAVGDYQIGRITGKPSINFAFPIRSDSGEVLSVIFVSMDLAWLNRFAAEADLPAGATLLLTDQTGVILARHPDPGSWIGKKVPESVLIRGMLSQHGKGSRRVRGLDGVERLYVFRPLGAGEGQSYLSVGLPSAFVFAPAERALKIRLGTLVSVALLSLALAWIAGGRSILRRAKQAVENASTDILTGVGNRRHLFGRGEIEIVRARRLSQPLSAILLDVDHFKRVNDAHGHAAGDAVLRGVAQRCREQLRGIDVLGRYGGEEFGVVLPGAGLAMAREVAERLRRSVEDAPFETGGLSIPMTISLGVAEIRPEEDMAALLGRADQALYAAKEGGRNRVEGA